MVMERILVPKMKLSLTRVIHQPPEMENSHFTEKLGHQTLNSVVCKCEYRIEREHCFSRRHMFLYTTLCKKKKKSELSTLWSC